MNIKKKIEEINKIYNDDFRNYEIPNGIIITDPPYNQKFKYNLYKDNLSNEEYIELLSNLNKNPCVLIHYPEQTINLFPKIFGKCEQVVAWIYNSTIPKQHRLVSWWGCAPDFSKFSQPYKNPKDKRIQKRIAEGKQAKVYDWWEIQQVKNVSKEKTIHPCQTPEEVIRRIILTTCNKNDLIIDPFAGSGSTLKIAKELGYNYLGFEIDPKYYEVAENRVANTSYNELILTAS